jgi:hypothetical protein
LQFKGNVLDDVAKPSSFVEPANEAAWMPEAASMTIQRWHLLQ